VHASDKEAADAFKGFEDKGDELVQVQAMDWFGQVVAGEHTVVCNLATVLREACPAQGKRSWSFRGSIIASVRPASGAPWPAGAGQAQDLRVEPKSGNTYADGTEFAQFDLEAPSKLENIFPRDTEIELKLYSETFWEAMQDWLYEGNEELGSHNQTFSRAYGHFAGAASGSNRTEVMNYFADLLGFHDIDQEKSAHACYAIWAENHAQYLPSQGLEVSFGFGSEFKADKLWQQKKEANVAEALIGALQLAGYEKLVKVAAGWCFLSYIATPSAAIPSNWTMSDKVLGLKEMDDWRESQRWFLKHFNVELFIQEMEKLLQ